MESLHFMNYSVCMKSMAFENKKEQGIMWFQRPGGRIGGGPGLIGGGPGGLLTGDAECERETERESEREREGLPLLFCLIFGAGKGDLESIDLDLDRELIL